MSEKLYLYKPGENPIKLAFTIDDLPILKEWYDLRIKSEGMPEFKELPIETKNNMANTVSFAGFRLGKKQDEFYEAVKMDFKKLIAKIKTFFRWKN